MFKSCDLFYISFNYNPYMCMNTFLTLYTQVTNCRVFFQDSTEISHGLILDLQRIKAYSTISAYICFYFQCRCVECILFQYWSICIQESVLILEPNTYTSFNTRHVATVYSHRSYCQLVNFLITRCKSEYYRRYMRIYCECSW